MSLILRSSIGSILSATASSSIALSSAYMYGISTGARMNPEVWRSALTKLIRVSMAGLPYMEVVTPKPASG
jgi:hypothetical protein